jgi:hypothetical protein
VFFYPFALYVIPLGLLWFVWKRRWKLDRREALFWCVLTVCATWSGFLIALIPNQEYASPYGQQVLTVTSIGAIFVCAAGVLAYSVWPLGGVPSSDRERQDFRNGVAVEVYSLLTKFADPLQHRRTDHWSWSGKADESKAIILGKQDYLVLRSLYDAIDERNKYFDGTTGYDPTKVDPLNLQCVKALSRAYNEVSWLKTESDTDTLLARARKSVGLPESPLETKTEVTPKPYGYALSLAQEREGIRMHEIRVVLSPNNVAKESAWFYILSIGVPPEYQNTEEVQLFYKNPDTTDLFQMEFISTTGRPWIAVKWHSKQDFLTHKDRFAAALTDDRDVKIRSLRLDAGGGLIPFIFCFTVRGFERLYFPSPAHRAYNMPTKFQTGLWARAKGKPLMLLKMFEIEAKSKSWDSVTINEVRSSS